MAARSAAHAPLRALLFRALSPSSATAPRAHRRRLRVFARRAAARFSLAFDARRVSVVYPGVAADFCSVERRGGDGRTILAVGTVERRKNLELLIRALPELAGARLVSVGPPTPYQHECAAIAAALGVADRVELRGYVDRRELLELYATCGVVAVPSRYEGFGYAAAQALCAGAPCVVSDRSALPEVVAGDARVLPVGDEPRGSTRLRAQLRGDDDARAAAARARSIDRFAWAASARAMCKVYEAALGA